MIREPLVAPTNSRGERKMYRTFVVILAAVVVGLSLAWGVYITIEDRRWKRVKGENPPEPGTVIGTNVASGNEIRAGALRTSLTQSVTSPRLSVGNVTVTVPPVPGNWNITGVWDAGAPPAVPTADTTEYILSWRYYGPALVGAWQGDWGRGYLRATCMAHYTTVRDHPAPNLMCECGIYGFKRMPNGRHNLIALCAMSGTIVEHTDGYRAEHCQIVAYTVSQPGHPAETLWKPRGITQCKTGVKLAKVHDFYTKNPDALFDEVGRLTLERQFAESPSPEVPF